MLNAFHIKMSTFSYLLPELCVHDVWYWEALYLLFMRCGELTFFQSKQMTIYAAKEFKGLTIITLIVIGMDFKQLNAGK